MRRTNMASISPRTSARRFREALALVVDNLEYGFLTNTEYWSGKKLYR